MIIWGPKLEIYDIAHNLQQSDEAPEVSYPHDKRYTPWKCYDSNAEMVIAMSQKPPVYDYRSRRQEYLSSRSQTITSGFHGLPMFCINFDSSELQKFERQLGSRKNKQVIILES